MRQQRRDEDAPAVVFGAAGWDYDAWQGSYYPEDLPPEWRLTYYANEHRAVLVPARDWAGAPSERWEQWVEDVHAGFRFFLELPRPAEGLAPALHSLEACAGILADRLGGVLAPDPVDEAAAGRLADSAALWPVLLRFSAPAELAEPLSRLAERGMLGRWGVPLEAAQAQGLEAALLSAEAADDLRLTRAIVEALSGGAGHRSRAVFLIGSPPDPARLERLRTLAGLMGLA